MHRSDTQLIEDYLNGDVAAFEVLVARYLKPVYGFVYRRVGTAGDAEDITQDTFMKAWRHIKRFDRAKSFKPWIFTIAKNTLIDFLKKKKTIPFSVFDTENGENMLMETVADSAPEPSEIAEQGGMARAIESAAAFLAPQSQAIFSLHHANDLTFREIARTLGEPVNTVKSRYRRALAELRKLLGNQ